MKKRLGKIIISRKIAESEQICEIFSKLKFFPYKVEYLYNQSAFEMIGISPLFNEISEGYEAPIYQVVFYWLDDVLSVNVKTEQEG